MWQSISKNAQQDGAFEGRCVRCCDSNIRNLQELEILTLWFLEGDKSALVFRSPLGCWGGGRENKNPYDESVDGRKRSGSEYALWSSLVSLAAVASMSSFSSAISKTFSSAAANLTDQRRPRSLRMISENDEPFGTEMKAGNQ